MIRRRACVLGKVQMVGFRAHCEGAARRLCLIGWVRNMNDKVVELEVQGPEILVKMFLKEVETGSFSSKVRGLIVNRVPLGEETEFATRFDG